MKTKLVIRSAMAMASLLVFAGCADEIELAQPTTTSEGAISLTSSILQDCESRANDDGFAEGDRIGVYIVDYQSQGVPGILSFSGNRASNAPFTFQGGTKWTSTTTYYWKDKTTPIDVYGYYPYSTAVDDVQSWDFEVSDNQNAEGAYEASDFLWAKAAAVAPTSDVIHLKFNHRMAGVMVTLTKGSGITDTEWDKVEKMVSIDHTVRRATIDLSTGIVTPNGSADKYIQMADQGDCTYRAVAVPQQIEKGTKLMSITIDGTSYAYTRTEAIALTAGKLHRFTMKIDKKEGGDYTVSLVSEEITPWENDKLSHSFLEYEYLVVTVTEPGTLKSTIEAMGKNIGEIKNLKVVGPITNCDFDFMREEMSQLAMLNLKEATCKDIFYQYDWDQDYRTETMQNVIPQGAFREKETLRRITLPDNLIRICDHAFFRIGLDVNSSVILPKHLKQVEQCAFADIGEAGELVLNDELEYIGDNAFVRSAFTCELNLPQTLKHIGYGAFGDRHSDYKFKPTGHFILPDGLEFLAGIDSYGAIGSFDAVVYDEVGEIIVPEFMTTIYANSFPYFTKGCTITLHDNVKQIGAFIDPGNMWNMPGLSQRFINKLVLPEGFTTIGTGGLHDCQFNGGISIPSTLKTLGNWAFFQSTGIGDIEMPDGILYIPTGCFQSAGINSIKLSDNLIAIQNEAFRSSTLQNIVIGKNCEFIGAEAFAECPQLSKIVCLNPEPPTLDGSNVFTGMSYEHLILEVPVGSVDRYRNASGWNQISFITEYHELAIGCSELNCLDKGMTYNTLVRAEEGWKVTECPSWCHVLPNVGQDRRTEVSITIDPVSFGESREGNIVLKLNGSGYTASIKVNQHAYDHPEDTEIVFQSASSPNKEIPIILYGEGFDAESILNGTYMNVMREAYESIISIEPFKTYKDCFTISTAIAVSPYSGFEETYLRPNKFHTSIDPLGIHCDFNLLSEYAKQVSSHISDNNLAKSLQICVMNSNMFDAVVQTDNDDSHIALCCYSTDSYPYDFRGVVQHYALGRAFGRLAHETICHYTFLKGCVCPCCNQYKALIDGQARGWYQNASLMRGLNSVPWSHLVFHEKYSDIVDVYEGAWNHSNGVYRSENTSVMNTYIPYFNTYCRELLVRRIKEYIGEQFTFEDFVAKDSREGNPN